MKKKFYTLAVITLAASLTVSASDVPAQYLNLLGEGPDYVGLTVTWGDDLAVDNLVSAVRTDATDATVGTVLATALKADPRFYALKDAAGDYVAFGFDTDGDNSAAVTVGDDTPELIDGVATSAAGADLTVAKGSTLYDHWKVNGDEGTWQLYLGDKPAQLSDAVADGALLRLVYVAAGEASPAAPADVFYLRPATQRGAWMMPRVDFTTANGKQQYFPMIANVITRSDLYSGYIKLKVTDLNGNAVTSLGEYSQYRYDTKGGNMRVRFTPKAAGEYIVTPYVQTGKWKDEVHYEADKPTQFTVVAANPATGIRMTDWPAAEGETANLTLYDVVNFRAYPEPDNADFATVVYAIDDPAAAEIYASKSYDFDMFINHKAGDFVMTVTIPGTGITKRYPIHVADRDRNAPANYTDGAFWLSEEWFGHSNGSINYINPDGSYVLRAYEQQNPGESFGATSQHGIIYADKLIITSKQHTDAGDSRTGGGRLVVADAKTLKKLASFDYLGESKKVTADGRAVVGVNPHKAYVGSSIIGVLDLDNLTYDPAGIKGLPAGGSTYSGQYGDMVCDGRYVYATRQNTGVLVIDTEKDEVVKTIPNTNIQGITRTADGRVWFVDYARVDGVYKSYVYSIDSETLDVADTFELPSTVSCSWGSWRSTKFVGAKRSNKLIWGVNNVWDLDTDETPANVTPVVTSDDSRWPKTLSGGNQSPYGSIAFDDRTNEILWAGSAGFGTNGRFTWYNFTNIATGDIRSIRVLPDYYFFPAIPIIPQKYRPALVNPDYRVALSTEDEEPTVIDLTEVVDDLDNSPRHIRYALATEEPQTRAASTGDAGEPVAATLEGSILTLEALHPGETALKLRAESNGKEELISIPVKVSEESSAINDVKLDGKRFDYTDGILTLSGYRGVTVGVYDINGRMLKGITPESDFVTIPLTDLPAGVYGLNAADGHRFKILVK